MSNNSDSVEASDAEEQIPETGQSELDATAEAVAEAAEAIAGSEPESTAQPEESPEAASAAAGDATALQTERDQYFEQMKRAQAELENFRRRVQREAEQSARYSSLPLIRDLLPALDNLGRTIQAAEQTGKIEDLLQGLQMIVSQFDQVFSAHAAKPITAVGEPFDPNMHEAMQQIPTNEHPPMTVMQELERGYTLHDRVIRPSKVLVACALPEESPESADSNN